MIKLIALGNILMKDDGIAVKVAGRLKERLIDPNFDVLIGETDYQSCFYSLSGNEFIIILDALFTGAEPGSIHIFSLENEISQPIHYFMQHDIDIFEFMKMYRFKNKGYIIGIEVNEIGFGDELSFVLQNKFLSICSEAENLINKIVREASLNA